MVAGGPKMLENIFKTPKTQNLQNEAISDDDDKIKYSENPQNISQSAKKGYEG